MILHEEDLPPTFKRLLATLYRLKFENYLVSRDFDLVCLENNIDDHWKTLDQAAHNESRIAVAIPGYTGYAKRAFPQFIFEIEQRKDFLKVINAILSDFKRYARISSNMNEIKQIIVELGHRKEDVDALPCFSNQSTPLEVAVPSAINDDKIENLCFVLMPLNDSFIPIYDKIIAPAVKTCGLECQRADKIPSTKPVMDDICAHIRKAKILIADLSGKNPNVFYEVGYAHALGKEVIFITQNKDDIPFDVNHYRYVVYVDSAAGGDELRQKIIEKIKYFLKQQVRP